MKPFYLKAPCKDYLWGGDRLRAYGKQSDAAVIAESWELSCHPDGESVIASGAYAGMTLTAFLAQHPEALGENCRRFDRFPVLIKMIDADKDLSVQVHPDDAYALAHEGELGKTEMWYVIDAAPGAELIYGFAHEVTQEAFRHAIETNTLGDIVRHVPVQKGDVFFIPSGTLHAIGKGLLIAEVQENSNTTYRVYDYGRVGKDGRPRELHVEKALAVTHLTPTEPRALLPPSTLPLTDTKYQLLADCAYFTAMRFDVLRRFSLTPSTASFGHILVTEGEGTLTSEGETFPLRPGTSLFLPAGTAPAEVFSEAGCTLLMTQIGP